MIPLRPKPKIGSGPLWLRQRILTVREADFLLQLIATHYGYVSINWPRGVDRLALEEKLNAMKEDV